jgi:hypothetical protein
VLPLLLAMLLFLAGGLPAAAQELQVHVVGEVNHPAALRLQEMVARGEYMVLARDTVLPASFRLSGDLVVVGADVRLEGTVEGTVAVLRGGDFFVRPGARVGGAIVVLGGGAYPSTRAAIGDLSELPPEVQTRVERVGDAFSVYLVAPPRPPLLRPAGGLGVGLPTHNRVDGLTVRAGVEARLWPDTLAPTVTATALYHTARGDWGGEVQLNAQLGRRHAAELLLARHTRTNEDWIRGPLANTLAALALGSDARNYWESDEVMLTLRRLPRVGLQPGEGEVTPWLTLRASRDRSLPAREVWSLFGGDEGWRANPPVAPGELVSAIAGAATQWRGRTSRFAGGAAVEWAPEQLGDFDFAQLSADGEFNMTAMWRHTVLVRGHLLFPLVGDVPPQRWSFVDGSNTLPTLETGALRGDHVVFLESTYAAPVQRLSLPVPFLGPPSLAARHAIGSAWPSGEETPRWEQNLGLGVIFSLAEAFLYLNPADPGQTTLSLGARLPF